MQRKRKLLRTPNLSIIVPVFFRLSKKTKREIILLDVVNWVVLLNNYKHDKRNSFKTCLFPDIKMRAHVFYLL